MTEERSAQSYVDALNAVIGIVGMAVPLIVPGGKAAKGVGVAAPIAAEAARAIPKVAPAVAPAAKKVAEGAAKTPHIIGEGAGRVAGHVLRGAGAVGGALGSAKDKLAGAKDARAQKRARELARRTLLDGAGVRMSATAFLESWSNQAKLGASKLGADKLGAALGRGYLDYPGCYVILTCPTAVKKDDYSHYRDLYVGAAPRMGEGIYRDFIGLGNPDVYADVKYKQHVYVLLFPCMPDDVDDLRASLITALDADESYNRPRTVVDWTEGGDAS